MLASNLAIGLTDVGGDPHYKGALKAVGSVGSGVIVPQVRPGLFVDQEAIREVCAWTDWALGHVTGSIHPSRISPEVQSMPMKRYT